MPPTYNFSLSALNAGAVTPAAFSEPAKLQLQYGNVVRRAAAALPQTALGPLFTVTGDIAIVQLYGKVGTVIQAQANAAKLVFDPTAGTDVDLCATLDINGKATLTMFSITGVVADAMIGAGLAVRGMSVPLFVQSGSISLNTAASSTGTVAWTLMYVPLSEGATAVAA